MKDKRPHQCDGCDHKAYPDTGYCYMFKVEPKPCFINTSKGKNVSLKPSKFETMMKQIFKENRK